MSIAGFDHAAIPTNKPAEMMAFYESLGATIVGRDAFEAGERQFFSVVFGPNKINVHGPKLWQNPAFTLRSPVSVPGCGDFCFVWDGAVDAVLATLERAGAAVEVGPVEREGGRGGGTQTGTSVYTRDPDGNLLEFIVYGSAS